MDPSERLARLEEIVRVRLDAVIDRLDRMNGRLDDHEQRLLHHDTAHHQEAVGYAAWRAQIEERLRHQSESETISRWRLALLVTTASAVANLVLQVVMRLR